MDGKVPPPIFEPTPRIWHGKWRRKYECPKNKGDHTWQLVVPEWGLRNRDGSKSNVSVEEYYITKDAEYFKEKREHAENGGLTFHGFKTWFWDARPRWWVCTGCNKHTSDDEVKPNKKIRDNIGE